MTTTETDDITAPEPASQPRLSGRSGQPDAGDASEAPATGWQLPDRKWLVAGSVAVAVAISAVVFGAGGNGATETDTAIGPLNTAEVVVTDLVQEVSFDGTLGTVAGDPIVSSAAGVVTDVAPAGSIVAEADVLYRVDNEPVVLLYGDTPAYRDLALGSDAMTVTATGTGVITDIADPGTIIEQGDVVYWVDGQPVIALYGETPAYRTLRDESPNLTGPDVLQLEEALADLGFDFDGALGVDGEFTYYTSLAVQLWQEELGIAIDGELEISEIIFVPGPSQVTDLMASTGQTLSPGAPVATLATGTALSGPDVEQLEQALADLGYDADGDMTVDDTFTAATSEAVTDWQSAIGQSPDGVIDLGDVVFLPGSIRVGEQLAATGAKVNEGAPILAISSAQQVVRVDVPAGDQGLVGIGDPVTVVLPGFEDAPATVASVSTTATVSQDGDTLFEAIVELDDPTVAGGLDEAPVTVDVAGDTATGVLAVPVTSLVALAEGGYAVEVEVAGGYQLVPVEPGFFANGLVAITGNGLSEGDVVTLP